MNHNKITHYSLIREDWVADLNEKVNKYLQEGWQPYGTFQRIDNTYLQLMVQYEEPTTTPPNTVN